MKQLDNLEFTVGRLFSERANIMEFNEKLQELRKQKGLTQEELAAALFVSRPTISKWESGRGYPSIDSLKAIAKFFGITIDALLSGEELLTIAEEDTRQKKRHFYDLVFGLLDCSTALFFFLPLFGQEVHAATQSVSLLSLTGPAPYLRIAYLIVVIEMVAWGISTLALQTCHHPFWLKHKNKLSFAGNAIGALLFIISSQPYAAALLFLFLIIKSLLLIQWQ